MARQVIDPTEELRMLFYKINVKANPSDKSTTPQVSACLHPHQEPSVFSRSSTHRPTIG